MYALMTQAEVKKHLQMIIDYDVSKVARSPGGFLYNYMKYGRDMLLKKASDSGLTWEKKRNAFIARHLVEYKKNPTDRHRHALIAWAYMP